MPTPYLDIKKNYSWFNTHRTHDVGGTVERLYTPSNVWDDGSKANPPFLPGLMGLQKIVRDAEADKKRVRAVGAAWSLSPIAFTNEYLVDTTGLGYWFNGFKTPTMVQPQYRAHLERLVFAQCGVQIRTLNGYLEQQQLALSTSGASNGQTIAGATSTGTHGSANQFGSVHDAVLGLHVVAEGGKHYWIERKSKPVATQDFVDWLGAELMQSDELFLAAVVGFGSFGLIHAIMIEVEPLYLLDRFVKQCDFPEVESAIYYRDLSGLGLPGGNTLPYHFEVVFNPYRMGKGDGGAFVRVLYKRPANRQIPAPHPHDGQKLYSQDLISIAGRFADVAPVFVPGVLQSQLESSIEPTEGQLITGTPGQQFGDSSVAPGGTSIEIGVAPDGALKAVLNAIVDTMRANPFGAPVALRWVKSSDAYLSLACFSPLTCTIEVPGIDSVRSRDGHTAIFKALEATGVRYTYHWGQGLPIEPGWVTRGFDAARVGAWVAARRDFLKTPEGRSMFANDTVSGCGLAT